MSDGHFMPNPLIAGQARVILTLHHVVPKICLVASSKIVSLVSAHS